MWILDPYTFNFESPAKNRIRPRQLFRCPNTTCSALSLLDNILSLNYLISITIKPPWGPDASLGSAKYLTNRRTSNVKPSRTTGKPSNSCGKHPDNILIDFFSVHGSFSLDADCSLFLFDVHVVERIQAFNSDN